MNRRKILESIEDQNIRKLRADIRTENNINQDEGKTHDIFNEMEKKELIEQFPLASGKTSGNPPIEVQITDKGLGYIQCMRDYGIGLK